MVVFSPAMSAVAPAPLQLSLPSSSKLSTSPSGLQLSVGSSSPRSLPRLPTSPYSVRTVLPPTPRSGRSPRSPRSPPAAATDKEVERAEHIESEDELIAQPSHSQRLDAAAAAAAAAGGGRKRSKVERVSDSPRRRRHDNKVHPSAVSPTDFTSSAAGRPVSDAQLPVVNKSPLLSSTQTSSTLSSSSTSSHNQLSPAVPPLLASLHPPALTASTTPESSSTSLTLSLSPDHRPRLSLAVQSLPTPLSSADLLSSPHDAANAASPTSAAGLGEVSRGGAGSVHLRPHLSIAIPPTPAHNTTADVVAVAGGYSPMQLPTSTNAPQSTPLQPQHGTQAVATVSSPASRQRKSPSSPRAAATLAGHSHGTSTAAALRTARAQPLISAVMSPYTLRFESIDQRTGRPLLPASAVRSQPTAASGSSPLNRIGIVCTRESLETLFLSHYFHKYNTSNRVSILISTIIWALFVINDSLKEFAAERQDFDATVGLRAADVGVGLLIALALGSRWLHSQSSSSYPLYEQLLMYVGMMTFGVSQIMFGVWQRNTLDPTYSMFMILIPSMAPTFFHQRFLFTCAFSVLLVPLFIILTVFTSSYKDTATNTNIASTFVGIVLANAFFCMFSYRREKSLREDFLSARQLEAEEKKSQALLNNMMPVSAVAKLRAGAEYIYNKHEDVTILFSHIAEFDDYTARLPPHRLVAFLNDLFYKFDQLTDELHVYKVETIGDVFLVCSNCPVEYEREDHAAIMCVMALAMMEVVREMRAIQGDVEEGPVRLKLGIHTGEVIAGVVGAKYPRFRLMGDTVNTASRMSTTTPANSIQLSPATHALISERRASDGSPVFTCKDRGPVAIKGKGRINTHFLLAHKYEYSRQHHVINTRNGHTNGGRRGASAAVTPREDSEQLNLDAAQADGAELAGVIRTRAQRIKGLGTVASHSPETHAEWGEEDVDAMLASRTPSFRQSVTASMGGSPVHFHADTSRPQSVDISHTQSPEDEVADEVTIEDSLRRTADLALQSAHSSAGSAGVTSISPSAVLSQYVTPRIEPLGRRPSVAGLSSRAQPTNDSNQPPVGVFHLAATDSVAAPASPLLSHATPAQVSPRVVSIQRDDVPRLPITNGSQSPVRRRLQLRSTSNLPSSPLTAMRNVSSDSNGFTLQAELPSAKADSRASNASNDSLQEEMEDDTATGNTAAALTGHNRTQTQDSCAAPDLARGTSGADPPTTTHGSIKSSHRSTTSLNHSHTGEPTQATKKQTRWDSSVAPDKRSSSVATAADPLTDAHTSPAGTRTVLPVSSSASAATQRPDISQPLFSASTTTFATNPSKRDSGEQQKVLITATNDTVKMDKLFKLGSTQSILRPKGRRLWDYLTQRFITEPELEAQFQKHWAVRCTPITRFWVLFCVLAFIPLSIYETVSNLSMLDGSTRLTTESWLVRLIGVLLGGAYWWCTYRPFYQRYMQSITSAMLTIEGCLFIYMAIEFHDYDTSFGIGVTLILLCIVHMFVGLRFLYALLCSVMILLFYVVASRLHSSVPAVIVMVVAGNAMYAESNYWGEFLARQDYIRGLKRENEKVRTQQFLDNMLPPLVLTMIKQGNIVAHFHQAADVIFCDIVSFTSIASAIPAEDVVAVLNVMFSTYDALSTQYSVYKVETIGDCWMGCCGVVSHETNHTQNMIDFALAMIKSTRGFRVQTDQAKVTAAAIENVDKLQSPPRVDLAKQAMMEKKWAEGEAKDRRDSKTGGTELLTVWNQNGPATRLARSSLSFMLSSPTTGTGGTKSGGQLSSPTASSELLSSTVSDKLHLNRRGSATSTNQNSQSERDSVKGHPLVVRIGIHSGPVIAGVVGRKCARYHLFGETVTVAEEMEQHGLAGKVVISESTRQSMVAGMSREQMRNYELEVIEPLVRAEPSPNNIRNQRTVATTANSVTAVTDATTTIATAGGSTTPVLSRILQRYIIRRAGRGHRSKVQSTAGSVPNAVYSQMRSSVTNNGLASVTHAGGDKHATGGQTRGSVAQRSRRIALDAVVV